jgi:hypothetical protein
MILPENTIVAAYHRGMTVDGIVAILTACHLVEGPPFPPDTIGAALARAVELREEVLDVLRRHRPCDRCDYFPNPVAPPRPRA